MDSLDEYIGVGWENEPSRRTPVNAYNLGIMEDGIKRLFAYLIAGGGTGPGTNGREIELRNSGEYIQWRYSGEEDWTNLVSLADLKGEKGDDYVLTDEDIEEIASKVKVATSADKITYDDTETKLGAENVQDAIGKLSEQISNLPTGGSGLNNTAKNLLITILRNGVYSTDQSANITALETALSSGADIPDTPVEPEQPEIGIVQTGSILAITSGVTATQTGSLLAIA